MGILPQTRLIAIAALAAALCVTPIAAQETVDDDGSTAVEFALDPSWERFRVSIGGFIKQFDTIIRLDSEEHGIGTEIRIEEDFGIDRNRTDLRVFGSYRLSRRSDLAFGYYFWDRAVTHVLEEEIVWDGQIYEVGAQVDFASSTRVYQVSYAYSVLTKKKWDLRFSAGLSIFDYDVELGVEGEVGGGEPDGFASTSGAASLVAPVPALGFQARYAIGPDLVARARGLFFAFQADNWGGSMVDLSLVIDWFPWRHVGFGAGYNSVRLNYDRDKRGQLKVDLDYKGVLVYATLVF